MKKTKSEIRKKLKNIKIVLSDIDGVLTDGGMYYTGDGLTMKKFNVKDGMGAVLLKNAGIKVGIISTDKSSIGKVRGQRLSLDFVYTDVPDKKKVLNEICNSEAVTPSEVAFIGDDVNDLIILKEVGFSACPKDSVPEVIKMVHYVCKRNGGRAAFRELADMILKVQSKVSR
jgi:YrbI family 3-deoxy-D-manno-octulosonate 8-phosphate phosphatase